jgi:hypothetical protein
MKSSLPRWFIFLVLVSLAMMTAGGVADLTGQDEYTFQLGSIDLRITKHHLWSDGIYLLLFAMLFRNV